jgi:hypothetical protein
MMTVCQQCEHVSFTACSLFAGFAVINAACMVHFIPFLSLGLTCLLTCIFAERLMLIMLPMHDADAMHHQ